MSKNVWSSTSFFCPTMANVTIADVGSVRNEFPQDYVGIIDPKMVNGNNILYTIPYCTVICVGRSKRKNVVVVVVIVIVDDVYSPIALFIGNLPTFFIGLSNALYCCSICLLETPNRMCIGFFRRKTSFRN